VRLEGLGQFRITRWSQIGALGLDFTQLIYLNVLQMPVLERKISIINTNFASYIHILLLPTSQNGNNTLKQKTAALCPKVFSYIPKNRLA
jgi:hypothetical protein